MATVAPFRRRYLSTVTREGWYFQCVMAFVFLAALLREINLLMVFFGLMGGLFLFNWRSVLVSLRGLQVRRHLPERICAGDLLLVELEVANVRTRGTSWALTVEDSIRREGGLAEPPMEVSVLFDRVPPNSAQRLSYEGRLGQRGRYHIGPARISTSFPAGLMRSQRMLRETATMMVYPRLGRLTRRWQKLFREGAAGTRRVERQQGISEGEFHNLRHWRSGDSRRWVHWRTSARVGQIMVRQFERQNTPDLLLIVELWQPREPTAADRDHVELAVSLAATLASDACRRGAGQLVVALAGNRGEVTHGAGSTGRLHDVLERLAVAEPDEHDHLPQTLVEALAIASPQSQMVLVSTRDCELADSRRFAVLAQETRFRLLAARCVRLNTARGELDEYFVVE